MPPTEPPWRLSGARRWALAIATIAIALFLRPAQAVLTDPLPCGGLIDALVVIAARVRPDTPLLQILALVNGAVIAAAWLAFWRLADRVSMSAVAASAVTLAFAFSPIFDRVAAPTAAIGVLVTTLLALAAVHARPTVTPPSARAGGIALLMLLLAALAVPRLTLPAAIVAAAWPGIGRAAGIGSAGTRIAVVALTLVAGWTGAALVPDLPRPVFEREHARLACLLPAGAPDPQALAGAARTLMLQLGPVPLVAALVGAFRTRHALRTRSAAALMLAAVTAFVWTGQADAGARASVSPMLVGFWSFAACGLSEMSTALGATPARRIAALFLTAMIPLLQFSRAGRADAEPADRTRGHDTLTAAAMGRILSLTPSGGVLVVDDAISDMLARSQAGSRRVASGAVRFASLRSADAFAGESPLVLLMPRAQFVLGHTGFALRTDLQPRVEGIAVRGDRRPCHHATPEWTTAPALAGATRIAAVARDRALHGPMVIYLALGSWSEPRPVDWPDAARRGLTGRTYDRRQSPDAIALARWQERDRTPAVADVFGAPIVVRLELWRAAGGVSILPIDIGTPVLAVMTRVRPDPPSRPLALCPAAAGEIEPLK
jgi:hypothetical protein